MKFSFRSLLAFFFIFCSTSIPILALSKNSQELLNQLRKKSSNLAEKAPEKEALLEDPKQNDTELATSSQSLFVSASPIPSIAVKDPLLDMVSSEDDEKVSWVHSYLNKSPGSVFSKDLDGNTPLHIAARNGCRRIVRILLSKKATVNVLNFLFNTPLDVTVDYQIEKMLVQKGGVRNNTSTIDIAKPNRSKDQKESRPFSPTISNSSENVSRNSPGDYTTYVGPRGGVYHYSKSGNKVYHKR